MAVSHPAQSREFAAVHASLHEEHRFGRMSRSRGYLTPSGAPRLSQLRSSGAAWRMLSHASGSSMRRLLPGEKLAKAICSDMHSAGACKGEAILISCSDTSTKPHLLCDNMLAQCWTRMCDVACVSRNLKSGVLTKAVLAGMRDYKGCQRCQLDWQAAHPPHTQDLKFCARL